jgi:flagellar P-ring protein precursor FlgI
MRSLVVSLLVLTLAAAGAGAELAAIVTMAIGSNAAAAEVSGQRLKDVVSLQGPVSTPIVGYGLVIGLNKTGDRRQTIFSAQTLASMLQRFGVAVDPNAIRVENIAAVMVTAEIGPYLQNGTRIDVVASSIGDARSLQGGTLIATPLRAPDGSIVALAQGPLSLGGFGAGGAGASVAVNHLTVGRIPRGALLQSVPKTPEMATDALQLVLHEPDFASASHVAAIINTELGSDAAHAVDAGSVRVRVPPAYRNSLAELVARLEPLSVELDVPARVVINERTGTVVMGGAVRITPAAVAHGALSVRIQTQLNVSQPNPLSQGQTTVTPDTQIDVQEGDAKLVRLEPGTTLADVVSALNALGATPRDIIAILQALRAAGALHAEIVVL